jgi:hypothetical protein
VCVALVDLTANLLVLGAGNYSANAGLIKACRWMGLPLAAIAFHLDLARCAKRPTAAMFYPSSTSQRSRRRTRGQACLPIATGPTRRKRPPYDASHDIPPRPWRTPSLRMVRR